MGVVPALTPAQSSALARLNQTGVLRDVYLAGGVAVALHLGHRQSIDLDLFTRKPTLDVDSILDRLRPIGAATIGFTDATLTVRVGRVPIDFVRYPYDAIGRFTKGPAGVQIASLRDLAAMKLSAIARRGIRRDFWDLHEILTRGGRTLHQALDDYRKKFGVSEADVYHVIRALSWFDEAERDKVMPRGLTAPRWKAIRTWFEDAASTELARRATRTSR